MRRGKRGWKCTHIFQRFCRRVQRKNTAFLIWFLCWSPCQPLLHIQKRAPRWIESQAIIQPVPRMGEGQAITQPPSFYRMSIKPELNWNISSSRRCRSWLKGINISKSNSPGGMHDSGHRWLTRLMSLSRRYFPRWVWQRLLSYCPGASLW